MYILYSTSPSTLCLACLLILILLEFHFHIGESPWSFQLCWSVFHKQTYENPWAFHKEDDTAFFCYYYWHNELETSFPRTGVGRKLNRTFLLFIWHRLGNFIGNKCKNRGGDAQDGNWVCVTQAREIMVAVLVAVVMLLVMLTMPAAASRWAMHC